MQFLRSHLIGAAAILITCAATSASAEVIENATISNSYQYTVGGVSGNGSNEGGSTAIFEAVPSGGHVSEMGFSLTGTLDEGSFYFLHNGTCVGQCSVSLVTEIVFSLFNNGQDAVDLRFDSQITPGHLARANFDSQQDSTAGFYFNVIQDPDLTQNVLYNASGSATGRLPAIDTSDGSNFNGLDVQNNDPLWNILDWSATNLSVQLDTLAPGSTTQLHYYSILNIATYSQTCVAPPACESFQVAFGDPRNAGGVMNALAFGPIMAALDDPLTPAVGAPYDPFRVNYRFVEVGSPFPSQPEAIPPIVYDTTYLSPGEGAVPEPGTWLLLMLGFALLGQALRSQGGRLGARAI